MIILTIASVILASLAFVQAAEPNLNELKNFVLDKMPFLHRTVDDFQSYGYYTMGNQSEYALKRINHKIFKIRNFPGDSQIEDLDLDHYRTYKDMLGFSIRFPLLWNATNLSDDLKSRALFTAADKIVRHDITTPNAKQIIDMVMRTIHQEKGVLSGKFLLKPSLRLETLYAELDKVCYPKHPGLSLTSTVLNAMAYWIQDHCMLPDSSCSYRLGQNMEKYFNLYKLARLNVPIDSETKVKNLLEILPESIKLYKEIVVILKDDELLCLFTMDDCKKWSEDD